MKISFNRELLPYQVLALSYMLVVFSYPMPPRPGLVEVLMGIGLSIGCVMLLRKCFQHALWQTKGAIVSMLAAMALFLFPLVVGLAGGNGYGSIIRDVFPMLFLLILIPLVSYSVLQNEAGKVAKIILGSILLVGIVSAAEFMVDANREYGSLQNISAILSGGFQKKIELTSQQDTLSETAVAPPPEAAVARAPTKVEFAPVPPEAPVAPAPTKVEVAPALSEAVVAPAPIKVEVAPAPPEVESASTSSEATAQVDVDSFGQIMLPNTFNVIALHIFEPAVLFAAIFCGCLAMTKLSSRQFVQAAIFSGFAMIAAYGMMVLRLRAPSFLLAVALVLFMVITLVRSNPKNRVRIATLASIALAIGAFFAWDLIVPLIEKQMAVGLNGKSAEWVAVIDTISKDSLHLFFGYGWGAEFYPAYQPFPARYTHSVISFILLKAGVIGLVTFTAIYFQFISNFVHGLRTSSLEMERWAIVLAVMATLIIGLILQPTYKMLSFSFVVILGLVSMRDVYSTIDRNFNRSGRPE